MKGTLFVAIGLLWLVAAEAWSQTPEPAPAPAMTQEPEEDARPGT